MSTSRCSNGAEHCHSIQKYHAPVWSASSLTNFLLPCYNFYNLHTTSQEINLWGRSYMKTRLKAQEYLFVASMLFGLVFGAGNLIFPAAMGQQAGSALYPAVLGFCITGVGLPLLGIIAISISSSEGLFDIGCKVGRSFSYFFTCGLYLCIGPLFAIPRTSTVSFQVGAAPLIPEPLQDAALFVFTLLFFAAALYFSLRPSGILTWIGKILNPIFLFFLSILILTAILHPMGDIASAAPTEAYRTHSFFTGLIEGYNTMDVLAALAFGNILVHAIKGLGLSNPKDISFSTIIAGCFSTSCMAVIYCALTYIGAQSRSMYGIDANGGDVLYHIALHCFGSFGSILLGIIITFACLKTAIGLITACSTTFSALFPKSISYNNYVIVFSLFSFGISNVGLSRIITYSLPVLYFLYPISIVLIFLCLIEGGRGYAHRCVFICTIGGTMIAAAFDFIGALPPAVQNTLPKPDLLHALAQSLPLSSIGMGWVVPAAAGFCIGIFCVFIQSHRQKD